LIGIPTPKEKWQEIAQYLALSDGFRGKVTSVKTSDPCATDKPFEVEYELTQEKFVDWLKKPVRIPALLPLPGLPEAPKKPSGDSKIELGPPLDVELRGTLRLPPGMTAQAPPGTSVKRDYASFTAEYSSKANVLRFSRRLNFVSQNISGTRFVDFGAFLQSANPNLPKSVVADLVKHHVVTLKTVIDAQAAKDPDKAYVALRTAAGHMQMIADPLAEAIVKQFPDKFRG